MGFIYRHTRLSIIVLHQKPNFHNLCLKDPFLALRPIEKCGALFVGLRVLYHAVLTLLEFLPSFRSLSHIVIRSICPC